MAQASEGLPGPYLLLMWDPNNSFCVVRIEWKGEDNMKLES
jgi:hypothetical protein